jgi:hypothetical protein
MRPCVILSVGSTSRDELMGGKGRSSRRERIEHAIDEENDEFVRAETQRQELIIREVRVRGCVLWVQSLTLGARRVRCLQQDEQLGELANAVGRVKVITREISTEIDSQNSMLDRLKHEVERTQERVESAIKKGEVDCNAIDDACSHCFSACFFAQSMF